MDPAEAKSAVKIETASKADWPTVLSVTKSAYSEYASQSDQAFWRGYEQSIEKAILTDENGIRIVAKIDSEIVGSVLYCSPYERLIANKVLINPFPEMRLLAVLPEFRNFGIADKLIKVCEERAAKEDFQTITLHTTVLMQTAKQMYERRGYSRYPEIDFNPIPEFVVWGFWKNLNKQNDVGSG